MRSPILREGTVMRRVKVHQIYPQDLRIATLKSPLRRRANPRLEQSPQVEHLLSWFGVPLLKNDVSSSMHFHFVDGKCDGWNTPSFSRYCLS